MTCALQAPEQWGALALSFVTSTVIFLRKMLVLNRYAKTQSSYAFVAWFLSLVSGILFWITINSLQSLVTIQIATGVLSTTLAWVVLVLLVNESLQYPTRQQWVSLAFYALTEGVTLIQVRLIVDASQEHQCVVSL